MITPSVKVYNIRAIKYLKEFFVFPIIFFFFFLLKFQKEADKETETLIVCEHTCIELNATFNSKKKSSLSCFSQKN